MKRLLPLIAFLTSLGASAQTVNLLKDINTSTNATGSSPANFTNASGTIFFTANDLERGTELWKTDGTEGNTVLVKDINQGSSSSSPSNLVAIGSTVYFSANDGVNGTELWKSDGTANGTVIVKDINSGVDSSSPLYIIAVNTNLYFSAFTASNGRELWKSDGTEGNTVQLTEIYSGITSSSPTFLTNANGTVYFRATHPSYGTELWKTTGGTPTLVEDIYVGSSFSSNPSNLIALNAASSSVIFFSATDATNGTELWKSEGTAATTSVQSIYDVTTPYLCGLSVCYTTDYSGSSSPAYFASTGTYVFFAATSPTSGREVWRHNGTTFGLVEDEVASGDLDPWYLTAVGTGTVFFSGNSSTGDRELYKVTVSTDLVDLVTNINASADSNPSDFEPAGTTVFFSATGANGTELWKATTSTGAAEVANINPGTASSSPTNKAYLGGKLYVSLNNGTSGAELWKSDGTSIGTVIIKDINGGSEDGNPVSIFNTGTTLYFSGTTNSAGAELWRSDGTNGGTMQVADVNNVLSNSSSPFPFAYNNFLVHFRATTATKGNEFHVSTGAVGSVTIQEINTIDETGSNPSIYGYATLGSSVYFTANHPSYGYELYRSINGSTATLVTGGTPNSATGLYTGSVGSYPQNLTVVGSYVYFSATDETNGTELFRVSGSTIEATENLNISGDSNPSDLCAIGTTLYFAANNGSDGIELYKTTGTTITMVKTGGINAGSANANPQFMTNVNGTLFFRAINGSSGSELWKSDGTSGGTVQVKDIDPIAGSNPSSLTAVGSILYFTAGEATYGNELYKSDGTTLGTTLVKDILAGPSSSSPSRLKNINGTLYFRASDGTGLNLMKTNGTTAGTIVATSTGIITYQGVDEIQYLSPSGIGNVYWVGTTNTYGKELLYVRAEPLNQPTSLVINGATGTTLDLSWAAASGSPAGYIVIRNAGGLPTGLPVDGTSPTLNTTLASGTGSVAYVGPANSFTDLSLSSATTYYYAVYSYNNGGSGVNVYKPHTPLTGNNFTLAANPATQASLVNTSSVTTNSITVSWTSGDGAERIVLAQQIGTPIGDVPVDATAYTASATFGSGSVLGSSRVVYRGSGSSVNVTNLSPGQPYQFIVFELNGTGSQTNYLTSIAGATGGTSTLALTGNQPTDLIFSSIGTTQLTLSWTDATAGSSNSGYLVTRKAGSDPTDPPNNGNTYSGGLPIPLGSSTIVFSTNNDLNTSFTDFTVNAGTLYYYRVYAKTSNNTYVLANPLTGSQTTFATEPTGAPGAITLAATPTSLTGDFTVGTGATSYVVLQKEGSAVSPDEPVDGATYAVGNTIGMSTVVFVGTLAELPFVSSGLTTSTTYHFAAFSAAGSGASTNYLTSSPSIASRSTLVDEPVDQPSNFVFDNLTSTSFGVSFTDAPTIPDGYLVLRRAGSAVEVDDANDADAPDDGVAYSIGNFIGSAEVVSVGSSTAFGQSLLTPGVTYYYAALAYMGSGETINYLVAGSATGSRVTLASQPASQPTSPNFTLRNNTSLTFSFTAAASAPSGYLVLRSSGGAPTSEPIDGVQYSAGGSIGADVVVQVGSSLSVADNNFGSDLIEDTQYYYAIFSYNGTTDTYNYLVTSPLQTNAFTYADEPIDHPINMAFTSPTTTSMIVGFDEPAAAPAGYLVLRNVGSAPAGIPVDGTAYSLGNIIGGDGTVVHIGSTPSFTSSGLVAGTDYHYAVYPYKGSGVSSNFLTAATVAAPPVPVLTGNRTSLQPEPASQPTVLTFSSITTSTVQVNFTASGASRYVVVRRASTAPIDPPVDGVDYTNNTTLGSGVVTYISNAAGFPFTDGNVPTAPIVAGTTYHYAIYALNGSAGSNNYLTTSPLTGSVDILALEPTAQPTALTFSSITSNSLSGSFTAAAGTPDGYLVVKKQGGAVIGNPVSGVTYSAGDPVGDGTVVQVGSSTSFNDTGLSAAQTYHYRVYSYNGSGGSTNYRISAPLNNSQTTLDTEPPQPTAFVGGSVTETTVDFSFTPSTATRYLILRKEGSTPADVPVDGTGYTAGTQLGSSDIVVAGTVTLPINDTGLSAGKTYTYKVFGFNGASAAIFNYNTTTPLVGSVSTLAVVPTAQPTALGFTAVTGSTATVSFTAATGSPTGYVVIRKQGSAPSSVPADGTTYTDSQDLGSGELVVSVGSAVSFGETGLGSEATYYYGVYAYNGGGGTINYLTTGPLSGNFTTLAAEPAQPTAFSASSVTTTTASISMTLSAADHYLILRFAGSAPPDVPVDGTGYTTGTTLGGGSKVVFAGDITLPVNETLLTAATVYHYAIYAYNGTSAATYNYNTTLPLTGTVSTHALQPANQPTGLVFTGITASSATTSFTAAVGAPTGYLVIRREGQASTDVPVDGETYTVNQTLINGTVVSVGSALTFGNPGLSAETEYYYQVYAFNGSGATTNYLTTSPLSGNFTTHATEPAQPTAFSASGITSTTASISMTLSAADHYLILRFAGSAPPDAPVDGTGYTTGTTLGGGSKVVLAGEPTLPINETLLTAATVYHYAIYAYNGTSAATYNYNTTLPLTGTVSTHALQPANQPTGLVFTNITASSATTSFTAAAGAPAGYLVIRSEDEAPTDVPVDGEAYAEDQILVNGGTVVSVGGALTFGNPGLSAETEYYYQVYAFNGSGATTNYLLTSPLSGNFTTYATEPAQPTAFSASGVTTTTASISMTLSSADHYLILRFAGSTPPDAPVDGTGYTTGTTLGGGSKVVLAGEPTLPINETLLTAATVYHYTIYAYNGTSAATYNYNTTLPLTGTVSTHALQPANQPTGLVFTSITSSSATTSFTAATGSPSGYLVIRREDEAPTDVPVDGETYAEDQILVNGGTVVSVGGALTFSNPSLSAETEYYYQVYAFNGSGATTNYLLTSPLSGNFTTYATEPAQPTAFSASGVTTTTASISMTLSSADHYLILRFAGSTPPDAPVDGTGYTTGTTLGGGSKVVLAGDITLPVNETDLTAGTVYHYAIYAYNGTSTLAYNYNTTSPLTGNVETWAAEPSAQPTALVFGSVTSSSVIVSFTAAAGAPDGYLVIQREGQAPSGGPADGTSYAVNDDLGGGKVISIGSAVSVSKSGLTSETSYYYQVYAFNGSGSTSNYLSTSPLGSNFITFATEPAQPTNFSASNVTTSTLSINLTLSGADHYLILRHAGSAPPDVPDDGTAYTTGTTLGGGSKVVLAGNITLPVEETLLTAGTDYHYAIYAYNGTSAEAYNYNTTSPLTGNAETWAAEPSAQPTGLVFGSVTSSSVIVSFTAAAGAPDGYLVIQREGQAPSGGPVDGTGYAIDANLGGGKVISIGSAITVSKSDLTSETTYYYQVYAYNGSGSTSNYLSSSPLSGDFITYATEPAQPTNFSATNITTSTLSINMTLSNAEHYLILRHADSAPSETPTDGTAYTTGATLSGGIKVVLAGDVSGPVDDSGLLAGTVYHYAIYGYNGSETLTYNYNTASPLTGNVKTMDAEPSAQPTALMFGSITSSSVIASFTAAAGAPAGYLVIQREGQAPSAGPADGQSYAVNDDLGGGKVISVGAAVTVNKSGLTPESTYYYQVYAYNGSGATSNYLSTSPLSGNFTTYATEPAQPTNFSASGITTTTASINITLSGADHYLILRHAGSAPPDEPVDGNGYTTGTTLGGGSKVVLAGDITLPVNETLLTAGTDYHYAIYAYNGNSAAAYNYNTVSPLTGNVKTWAAEPSAQPTALMFGSITSSSVIVSFAAAVGVPEGYLVIQREGQALSGGPADGTSYTVGADLGGGKVISVGPAVAVNKSDLTPETKYYYQVYSYNGSGSTSNYLSLLPLSGSFTTLATEPTQPTAFNGVAVGSNAGSISFSLSNAQHYLILRKAGSPPQELPTDGNGYVIGEKILTSDIVWAGSISQLPVSDPTLSPGTVYFYAVFAYNGTTAIMNNYNTSSPLTGSIGTLEPEPTAQATGLTFTSVTPSSMMVSYTAASGSPDGYLVVRRQNTAPSLAPTDGKDYAVGDPLGAGGTIEYVGDAVSFNDLSLGSEALYFYSVYAFNGSGLTTNYRTTSPLTGSRSTLATEPAPATGFIASNINTNSLSIDFTQSDAQHYLILRKASTPPSDIPLDGVSYTVGVPFGGSDVVLAGDITSLPITDQGLNPGTVYHYKIFGYNGGTAPAYNYSSALSGSASTKAAEPTGQPGALTFSGITANGATVSYPAAAGSPQGYLVVRRQDTPPVGTPADGTPYAVGDPFGTGGTVAYVGDDLGFTESTLTPEKTYHYRAYSFNGDGLTINYLAVTPATGSFVTLATEPAAQPTLIDFGNVLASSWTVSFTAATGTVSGYIAIRKLDGDPTGIPIDGTSYAKGDPRGDGTVAFVGTQTTFSESLAQAPYHYAIYAFNGSGSTINYRTVSPLLGTLPTDGSKPTIVDLTSDDIIYNSSHKFSFTIADPQSGIDNAKLLYRPLNANGTAMLPKVLTLNDTDPLNLKYEVTLTDAEIGEQGVYYQAEATNTVGLIQTSNIKALSRSFTTQSLPKVTGGTAQSAYRIISIPLLLESKLGSAVFSALDGRVNGKDWRMFRYEAGQTREITDLKTLNVEPGKGYWLIAKNDLTIAPGAGLAVNTDTSPFTMNLTPGWNQIGNPYLFNILWSDVNDLNSTQLELKLFNGASGFGFGNKLPVFSGGFVDVGTNTSIEIPTTKNPAANRDGAREPKTHPLDSEDWEVIINLRHGDIVNPFGGVGMSRDASESYDYFDDFSLPRFVDYVEMNYPKRVYGMVYTKDIIPVKENHVWEFSVDANTDGVTELNWDNTYFGANDRHIILWDDEEQLATDMRKKNSYSFVQGTGRTFKIFFGDEDFVKEQSHANAVHIHTISPNPTLAEATVAFSIPGEARSQVNVRVVNGMGQEIAVVFDGELEAGFHTIQWSGLDAMGLRPATGVYVVEVISGDNRASRRLVVK